MKKVLIILFLIYLQSESYGQKWQKLFNGKDLTGWHIKPGGKWEVIDGILVGTEEKSDVRHGLLISDKSFKDFIIKVKYKAISGNSGVYFRIEEIDHVVGVKGFQAEIDPEKDAGGLYETMGRSWVVQPKPEDVLTWYKPNEWNEMTIEARGGNVVVKVNGKESARLTNDPGRTEGKVALQLHGNLDMHVMFKEVKIKEL